LRSGSHVHDTVVSESGSGNNVRQGERVDLQVADRRPCCCANLGNAHGSGPRSFAGSIARRHVRWEADWVDDCAGWNFLSQQLAVTRCQCKLLAELHRKKDNEVSTSVVSIESVRTTHLDASVKVLLPLFPDCRPLAHGRRFLPCLILILKLPQRVLQFLQFGALQLGSLSALGHHSVQLLGDSDTLGTAREQVGGLQGRGSQFVLHRLARGLELRNVCRVQIASEREHVGDAIGAAGSGIVSIAARMTSYVRRRLTHRL
jgi:hypothetical protein